MLSPSGSVLTNEENGAELAGLSISNPEPGPHFDAFEQPPPPRISSEGIVAQDITQRFRSAAAGKPRFKSQLHPPSNRC
jgi:hypothetical protein